MWRGEGVSQLDAERKQASRDAVGRGRAKRRSAIWTRTCEGRRVTAQAASRDWPMADAPSSAVESLILRYAKRAKARRAGP